MSRLACPRNFDINVGKHPVCKFTIIGFFNGHFPQFLQERNLGLAPRTVKKGNLEGLQGKESNISAGSGLQIFEGCIFHGDKLDLCIYVNIDKLRE